MADAPQLSVPNYTGQIVKYTNGNNEYLMFVKGVSSQSTTKDMFYRGDLVARISPSGAVIPKILEPIDGVKPSQLELISL